MPITQVITALPDNPDPATDTPTVFSQKAAASVLAQKGLPTELNAFGSQANAMALAVSTDAANAATSAATATTQAAAAVSGVNAIAWVSGTTYTDGQVRYSPINRRTYRRIGGGAGTVDPSVDALTVSPAWVLISQAPIALIRSPRTANAILVAADVNTFIDIISGTFTQTFTAPATLGAGWGCRLGNSGNGDITIPASDGMTNWVMFPGEVRDFYTDGATFTSRIVQVYRRDWITSGTWTKAPGYKGHGGLMWNGGNSGQRTNNVATASAGGGGGGCFPFVIGSEALGATEAITIGAGGAAVTTVATGNLGGNTSLGSLLTVYANSTWYHGGSVVSNLKSVVSAGTCSGFEGGNGNAAGPGSLNGIWGGGAAYDNVFDVSGNSIYGGAGGGGVNASAVVKAAGTSKFGGNGGAASSAANGADGVAPGGGGGATQTGASSGAGARGELRMWGIV